MQEEGCATAGIGHGRSHHPFSGCRKSGALRIIFQPAVSAPANITQREAAFTVQRRAPLPCAGGALKLVAEFHQLFGAARDKRH
jgi:hypothetical protein